MIIFFSLSLSFFLLDMLYIESNDSANAQEQEEEKKNGEIVYINIEDKNSKAKEQTKMSINFYSIIGKEMGFK